jgi:hypothetical protein
MRVLRHRHTLGLIALLALAMQAVLALAHTHTHRVTAGSELATRAITYGMCRVGAERQCPPPAPHDDHAKCPLCWSMSLASAAVPTAPPAIALIHPRVEAPLPVRIAARVQGVSSVQFQARAPPRA